MKQFFSILVLTFYFTTNSNITENIFSSKGIQYPGPNTQTMILNYNAISCACPQWSESKYNNKPDKREYFYLERANNNLTNADSLWNGENVPLQIQVTGQIIAETGYSTGFDLIKRKPETGKVFRYSKIKVLQNGQKNSGAK